MAQSFFLKRNNNIVFLTRMVILLIDHSLIPHIRIPKN